MPVTGNLVSFLDTGEVPEAYKYAQLDHQSGGIDKAAVFFLTLPFRINSRICSNAGVLEKNQTRFEKTGAFSHSVPPPRNRGSFMSIRADWINVPIKYQSGGISRGVENTRLGTAQ
jgi:hypothetical protein